MSTPKTCPHPEAVNDIVCLACLNLHGVEDVGTVGDAVVMPRTDFDGIVDTLSMKGFISPEKAELMKSLAPAVTFSHGPEDEPLEVRDGAVTFPDGKVLSVVGEKLHLSPPSPTTPAEQEARVKFHDAAKPHGLLMGVPWSKTTQIPGSFADLAGETTDPRLSMPTTTTEHACACGGRFLVDGGKRVGGIVSEGFRCQCSSPKLVVAGPHKMVHGNVVEQLQAEITDLKGLLAAARIRESEALKDKAAVVAALDDVVVMMQMPERDHTRPISFPVTPYLRHVLAELVKVSKELAFDLAVAKRKTPTAPVTDDTDPPIHG